MRFQLEAVDLLASMLGLPVQALFNSFVTAWPTSALHDPARRRGVRSATEVLVMNLSAEFRGHSSIEDPSRLLMWISHCLLLLHLHNQVGLDHAELSTVSRSTRRPRSPSRGAPRWASPRNG